MRQTERALAVAALIAFAFGMVAGAVITHRPPQPVVTDILVFEDGSFLLETPTGPVSGCIPTMLCDTNSDFGDLP